MHGTLRVCLRYVRDAVCTCGFVVCGRNDGHLVASPMRRGSTLKCHKITSHMLRAFPTRLLAFMYHIAYCIIRDNII